MTSHHSLFELIARLQTELNRLFEDYLDHEAESTADWTPGIDVVESGEGVAIFVELPGVSARDLVVEAAGSQITISGVKPTVAHGGAARHDLRRERIHGRFARTISLTPVVNSAKASAKLELGILRIDCPKVADQRRRPTRIPVHSASDH